MKMNQHAVKAFTLIELMVVLCVIGVLVWVSIPLFRKVRSKARDAACINNERLWGTCFQMYTQDYGGRLYDLKHWDYFTINLGGAMLTNPYASYLKKGNAQSFLEMAVCPTLLSKLSPDKITNSESRSYSMSRPNVFVDGTYKPLPADANGSYWFNLNSATTVSHLLLLMDTDGSSHTFTRGNLTKKLAHIQDRHSGGMNALFADFHAEWVPYTKIVQQVQMRAAQDEWFLSQ